LEAASTPQACKGPPHLFATTSEGCQASGWEEAGDAAEDFSGQGLEGRIAEEAIRRRWRAGCLRGPAGKALAHGLGEAVDILQALAVQRGVQEPREEAGIGREGGGRGACALRFCQARWYFCGEAGPALDGVQQHAPCRQEPPWEPGPARVQGQAVRLDGQQEEATLGWVAVLRTQVRCGGLCARRHGREVRGVVEAAGWLAGGWVRLAQLVHGPEEVVDPTLQLRCGCRRRGGEGSEM
jgi:hypothetical protein